MANYQHKSRFPGQVQFQKAVHTLRMRFRENGLARWLYYRLWFPLPFHFKYVRTFRRIAPRAQITFYPGKPLPVSAITKICWVSGFRIRTGTPATSNLAIRWQDTTIGDSVPLLERLSRTQRVLNMGCRDISKSRIDLIHLETFGYGLGVDPFTYSGLGVVKSNANAVHEGNVIEFPVDSIEPGKVYQRLVDSTVSSTHLVEIRVPIFGHQIPFVILKHRPIADRFGIASSMQTLAEVDETFSAEELELIRTFCERVGLDYGELDVLRDRNDKRIYILDANNTPNGPSRVLTARDFWRAMTRMADAFESEFLS